MTHPVESTQEPPTSHFTGRVRWRSVAIPAEHGGWGMLFSPILLGLLVVPSAAGLFLALMVIAAFLARTPLKIIWKDRQRGRRYARTVTAIKVLGIYSLVILFGLTGALIVGGPLPLVPLFLVLPLAIIVLYFDLLSTSRRLLPELIAPVTLSAVVASMALAAGWDWPHTLALWSIPLMRSIPAVLFVRARIRLDRGRPAAVGTAILIHSLALGLSLVLVWAELIPFLASVAFFILLVRAAFGLSPYRTESSIQRLGWSEIVLGLMTVILSAIGYWTTVP